MASIVDPASDGKSELLHAAREWIWRHSRQPNGDRWTVNPNHLDWAAENLLCDVAPWLKDGRAGE